MVLVGTAPCAPPHVERVETKSSNEMWERVSIPPHGPRGEWRLRNRVVGEEKVRGRFEREKERGKE